ncbi:MAG: IS1 family transposase [Methyloglobulus sp.]|nr:IS1 family transposase [Methyloglobulus sp.]
MNRSGDDRLFMPFGIGAFCARYVAYAIQYPQGTRAETCTAEGYNSLLRHGLARLKRKTKCYSKSQDMLECSAKLFMAYWNNGKSIFI